MPKFTIVRFARDTVKHGLASINRVCKLCGISKATYYDCEHPDERFVAKYQQIKIYVEKIITRNSAYGIKRIKAALLQDYDITIGRDTLARLLYLWGLSLKRKVRKSRPSLIQKILISLADRTNLLIRSDITKPLQAITSDITELIYQTGKCYLCVHKDVFGQIVYGFSVKQTMEAKLVIESFRQALNKIKKFSKYISKQLLVHQDRGSQYTSYQYVEEILPHASLSYSAPGTPTDNPGQESFFGRFKQEWADEIQELKSLKEVQKFVTKKIKYYNCQRLHTSIGLMSPQKFTKLSLSAGL